MRNSRTNLIRYSVIAYAALSLQWASQPLTGRAEGSSYPELGITTAGPSIGYWWGSVGVRITGMYINGDRHNFHLNFAHSFSETPKVQHSINLLTSWVNGNDPGAKYRYKATGIAYSMNYKGLFFEIGFARPWKDELGNLADERVIPCGYLGYIYRFRP